MPVTIARKALSRFAVGAAIAIALSACSPTDGAETTASGDDESSSSPATQSTGDKDSSTAASPTTKSSSPTPIAATSDGPAKNWPVPKMPAKAKKHDLEGAAEFTKYYFELIEYTAITNESGAIDKVSTPKCELCQNDIIEPAKNNKKNGGWSTGGKFHPNISSAQKEGPNEVWVAFKYMQDDSYVYDPDKVLNRILHETPKPVVGSFFLEWKQGWQVNSVEIATS